MKKIIKSTNQLKDYIVTLGYDMGGPESGPIWRAEELFVHAYSEDDACRIVENYYDSEFGLDQLRWFGYEGCSARLATPSEIDNAYARLAEDRRNIPEGYEWDMADFEDIFIN